MGIVFNNCFAPFVRWVLKKTATVKWFRQMGKVINNPLSPFGSWVLK